jgi:uncharacterized protein YndB with AHSA1/START domain
MRSEEHQRGLRIERQFDVSPDVVFRMLTDPVEMRVWWGDDTEFDIDLRAGGRWTIIRREAGEEYLATGEYLVVDQPVRLVYTFSMPQFSQNSDTITVQIKPTSEGCFVVFEQDGPDIAAELLNLPPGEPSPSEAGWQMGFDLMDAAWSTSS